uniref:tRNA(Ile)-lysidine synthase n=1 Tax=Centroceras clavulatum TaxID=159503 RepID=A0A4D6WNS2_9FLOR|nr:tRNA Ile-lysidine synthetase [Centroceras clavulatum]
MHTYIHKYIIQRFKDIINITQKRTDNSILICISSGQDSISLIQIIETIKKTLKSAIRIEYLYIDHQWKQNSSLQIKHIINYLKYHKSPLYIYQIYKACYSETNARKIRHEIIINHAHKKGITMIITGHNLTDKIETFFQNLIKGTSINGATSLSEYRYINKKLIIFRPLINFTRNEIEWFCRYFYLPIWSDQTNYYYKIKRNRLRNELIPYLKNYFSIYTEININSFLQISNIDNEYLKQNTIKLYLKICHKKMIAINYKILQIQHIAIQARILQLFFFYHFSKFLKKELVQKLIIILNSRRTTISSCIYLWNRKNIYLKNEWLYIN